ncbi:hypothetical protein [Lacrimispora saccharolytica]|uniref:Uncharacterized protein n=1 Tax=Lacrimispora saccharolytica (strain ATCC 35040 / DSM 2544 / NRCC 2533 / WM1) TaxID=610130 RepID=D9R3B4_LACSW|nr:hypothetical protein [Lacrimispora saccharolytica]ADL04863.1 hypothetical protein Closa_2287 [[Clostridium] saccharolyticum WM1]QRV20929.1 hypothetical protein I6K70_05325 [Lacrimispora saccharolytica]
MSCFWGGCNNNCRRNCNYNCGCNNRCYYEEEKDECEKERREAYCAGFRDGCYSAARWHNDDDC